ncbi:hydroxymethylglutaryl-CoA lyase [Alicyclobacillus tolerans]|uniref:Hydroxymethylglutaryl-CoA lyase n=2 Tax=Alicyclobacillus tolerans TaxID=90970 RepID=A0ABT9LVT2_9BACL|nr:MULTISPECIES: hydroxymethylglutaryl-CoA lyase [Alicyclobacillus]MDP9728378.1 hydroxymethylglutaryl-CoA lyase [Alicyclobacillus tengchongensis]SHK14217.1 hydroxymethylglutaryl-CoA lyase [Alicyclobacillus montanus]
MAGVTLFEVGPRDGLQNESVLLSSEDKVFLVEQLMDAGLTRIEVSSFVSPRWIPQLADAEEVFRQVQRRPGVELSALVPNEKGLERALACQVDAVAVFMSASETHNLKNINKTRVDTYPVLAPVVTAAKAAKKSVRGYVSTAFGCPYEGEVAITEVIEVSMRLFEMGIDELSIGDTIGVAVPTQVEALLAEMEKQGIPLERIALHFHDTRGTAVANAYAGYQAGVRIFDGSIGGMGGCPYAPGASGNVSTEDLRYLFESMGVTTNTHLDKLRDAARWLSQRLQKTLFSHDSQVAHAMTWAEGESEPQ